MDLSFVNSYFIVLAGKVEDLSKVQTLLFSATLPVWVKNVSFLP